PSGDTPLPGLLLPGRALAAAVPVPVPTQPGKYSVVFRAEYVQNGALPRRKSQTTNGDPQATLRLIVDREPALAPAGCCAPLLETVQGALVRATQLQALPNDYVDITEGWFASCKRWLKRKLLNNFKRAYVDPLSRQQSAFNHEVLHALHELGECC